MQGMSRSWYTLNESVHSDDLVPAGEFAHCVPIKEINWAAHEARKAMRAHDTIVENRRADARRAKNGC